jgi:thiol-disulfide isomerase/thioredoxin
MKTQNILWILVIIMSLFVLWQWRDVRPVAPFAKAKAPDFSYTDINGQAGNLSDHTGKVILLHFWASWCGPCIAEFPDLLTRVESEPDKVVLLAVTVDKMIDPAKEFLTKMPTLPANTVIIHDANKAISKNLYGTFQYPETIIINREGFMTDKIIGVGDWKDYLLPE